MPNQNEKLPEPTAPVVKFLRYAILALLATWALVSLARIFQQTLSPAGGNDLYTYWYAGHFLREGKDPFQAFIAGELPSVPVHYLDRTVTSLDKILFAGLVPAPVSTPAAFYLFAPLAFLSWKTAKLVWLAANLLFLGLIPMLLIRFFPLRRWLEPPEVIGLGCLMVGLTSTRYAAASGQVTFLILDLMLGTVILAARRPWLAGVLLGLALSKYSLSIGLLVLFVLIEPRPKLILGAALVQLAGVVALMLHTGTGPVAFTKEYARMVSLHASMEGIHLAGLFPRSGLDAWIGLGLTVAVAIPLVIWRLGLGRHWSQPLPDLSRSVLAVLLSMWALLAVYHRAYDAMVMILFLALVATLAWHPENWSLSKKGLISLLAFGALAGFLLIIPSGGVVRGLLPGFLKNLWGQAADLTTTFLITGALIATFFLLFRLRVGSLQPRSL
jgi:hypothetical protein